MWGEGERWGGIAAVLLAPRCCASTHTHIALSITQIAQLQIHCVCGCLLRSRVLLIVLCVCFSLSRPSQGPGSPTSPAYVVLFDVEHSRRHDEHTLNLFAGRTGRTKAQVHFYKALAGLDGLFGPIVSTQSEELGFNRFYPSVSQIEPPHKSSPLNHGPFALVHKRTISTFSTSTFTIAILHRSASVLG